MKETGRPDAFGTSPEAGSWADETLPLGLRRELLDRELQKLIDRKNRGKSAAPTRAREREADPDRPDSGDGGNERNR